MKTIIPMMAVTALSSLWITGQATALEMEEIVVTAQKRSQSAQDVGITVNAFTGDTLQAMGLTSSNEIAAKIPNVTIASPSGEGGVAIVFVRGVGLNDFATNNTGPVGMYIDEVFAGSSNAQVTTLLDIERVEVLKGPQGTLFGRNTTGGAINIISAKPTESFEGYAKTSYGSYSEGNDDLKIEAAVSGPLSDSVRARAAFVKYESDGFMKNLVTGNYVEKDLYAVRGLLEWDASEDFSLLLNIHSSKNDSDSDLYNSSLDPDFYEGTSEFRPVLEVDQKGASLKVDYALNENVTLVSISSYEELEKFSEEDADMLPFLIIRTAFGVDAETVTQELRLVGDHDRAHWIAGLYYLTDDLVQDQGVDLTGAGLPIPGVFHNTQDTETWAAFGQIEYDLTDTLILTAGIRYTDLQVDFTSEGVGSLFIAADGGIVQSYALEDSVKDDAISGKLALNWHVGDDIMLYASISKGFKGAGINGNFILDLGAQLDYDSEQLLAYEVGIKSSLFDGTLQVNAALFSYDYSDAQIFNNDPVPGIGLPANSIRNSDITSYGLDMDVLWTPVSGLYLQLGVGYLNGEYDDDIIDPSTGLLPIKGNQLQNTPELTAFALVNYEWKLGEIGSLSAQLDANYSDDIYYSARQDIVIGQEAYTISNARLTYRNSNDNLEIGLWSKNLANKKYRTYSFDLRPDFGFVQYMRGTPRTVGIDIKYSF